MRILIVNEAMVGSGGVESYLASLMPALAARGHAIALLHANTRAEQGGTRIDRAAERTASVADDGLERALHMMREWRPDVCFSHNMRRLDIEERLLDLWPVVKMMHGYFGTCIGGQKAHAFPRITACTRTFGPACIALYLPRHCGQYRPLQMIDEFRWASRQRDLLPRYAAIVTASTHMADEYRRTGLPPSKIIAAPLFPTIDTPLTPRPLPPSSTVLFASRMTPIKGGDVAVRAVAEAGRLLGRPVKLLMAGGGPQRARLESLAAALHVDATFTGWVSDAARLDLIRRASVLAVPSLWPEPFGLSGLEAAVHGVPAVAFDVGGIREWLRDGVNGVLVREAGDAGALARALTQVLGDVSFLQQLGEGALAVAGELSRDAHVTRVVDALRRAAPAAAA